MNQPNVRPAALLLLLWVCLSVVQLPVREVMPPDESRFVHQAQVMRERGEWIVPYIGDVPNADKPPVIFWAANLFSLDRDRVTEGRSRILASLGALAALLLTLRLGRRLWDSAETGLLGAAIAVTTVEFSQKAQWMSCDMPLVGLVFGVLVLWREALFDADTRTPPRRRGPMIAAGWLLAAVGTLTKGPLGLMWPLWWVLAEAAARRRWRAVLALVSPPGLAGAAGYAALVFGWLTLFGQRSSAASRHEALVTQTVDRYLHSWNNVQPWYFFGAQTPMDFLPWSVFLPGAALLAWRAWRRPADGTERAAVRASVVFIAIALVFFSISPGKRGVYLLPLFPVLGMLVARLFTGGSGSRVGAAWRRVPLALLAAAGVVLGVAVPLAVALGRVPRAAALAERVGWSWLPALAVGGLALAAGSVAALRRRDGAGTGGDDAAASRGALRLAGGAAVLLTLLGLFGGAAWSRYQAGEPFGRKVAQVVPAGQRLIVERGKFELVLYYAGRRGTEFRDDAHFLELAGAARGKGEYAVLEEPTYERLKTEPVLRDAPVLLREKVSRSTFVVAGPL